MACKRITSLGLVLLLLFSSFYMTVEASSRTERSPGVTAQELQPFQVEKTVTPSSVPHEFQVEFQVQPTRALPTQDVVVVLDVSQSDAMTGGLQAHRELLTEFFPLFLQQGEHRVSLVTVAEQAIQQTDWLGGNELPQLLNLLETIPVGEGCYLEEGVRLGREILATSPAENRHLIVLSQGHGTYSSRVESVEITLTCTPEHHDPQAEWQYTPTYTQPPQIVGNGTQVRVGAQDATPLSPSYRCAAGKLHRRPTAFYPFSHGQTAVYEGELARAQGDFLFVIGVGADTEGYQVLSQLATGENLALSTGEGRQLLTTLLEDPHTAFTGTLRETIAPFMKLNPSSLVSSTGEVTFQEGELVWNLSQGGTLTYSMTLEVEAPFFQKDTFYPTGVHGRLEYEFGETTYRYSYTQPQIKGTFSTIFRKGVETNVEGYYYNERGELVSDVEEARAVTETEPWLNEYGVNQWAEGRDVIVTAQENPPVGYFPLPDTPSFMRLEVPGGGKEVVVYFPYVREEIPYSVEHFYEGSETPFQTEEKTAPYGTTIAQVEDSPILAEGYTRLHTEGLPFLLKEEGHVVRIIYKAPDMIALPYTISYYLTDQSLNQPYEVEECSTGVQSHRVLCQPDPNKYLHYELEKILFGEQEGEYAVHGTITPQEHDFKVYYRPVQPETPPPESQEYTYFVSYYYDGVLEEEARETLSARGNPPVVSQVPQKDKAGYQQVEIIPDLPVVLEAPYTEIRVYYEMQERPPKPIPPDPPITEPEPEPPGKLQMKVEHLSEDGTEEWESVLQVPKDQPVNLWNYVTGYAQGEDFYIPATILVEETSLGASGRVSLGESGVPVGRSSFALEPEVSYYTLQQGDYFTFQGNYEYQLYVEYGKQEASLPLLPPPTPPDRPNSSGKTSSKGKKESVDQVPVGATTSPPALAPEGRSENQKVEGEATRLTRGGNTAPSYPLPHSGRSGNRKKSGFSAFLFLFHASLVTGYLSKVLPWEKKNKKIPKE